MLASSQCGVEHQEKPFIPTKGKISFLQWSECRGEGGYINHTPGGISTPWPGAGTNTKQIPCLLNGFSVSFCFCSIGLLLVCSDYLITYFLEKKNDNTKIGEVLGEVGGEEITNT